ncbi:MAG: hypothetical protein JWN48_5395 [Myxococcaceae bacterium]|nr:hypothetical protein [Myxococcaceae bacterium]
MTGLSIVWDLLIEILGLRELQAASAAAHYWLSLSVMLRALAALWLVACTLVFSVRAVRLGLPGLGLPLRWSSIMGVGVWTSTMGFHALRGLGLFNLPAALLGASALLAAAVYTRPETAPVGWALRREWKSLRAMARRFARGKYVFVSSLFCGYVLLVALRSLITPPLGWDTLTYHGTRAVHWLQTNQFTFDPGPGPLDLYRHFFSGGEVLVAWALLPFHSDLLANFTGIVQWLGVGVSAWALARAIGVREPFAASSAGVIMLVPVLALEMNTGYVEAALNLALLNGIALGVHCLRRPSGRVAVAAAMSLGVAAGVKLPGAPPGLIVLAVVCLRVLFTRKIKLGTRAGSLALAALVAALPVLPWIYQAQRETGYLLTVPVKVLGLTLGVSSPAMEWYQQRPGLVPYVWNWELELQSLRQLFSPVGPLHPRGGPPLGSTALPVLLMALVGVAALLRKRPLVAAMLGAAMLAPWLTHFSAGVTIPRLYWSISVARYLITLLGIAIPVSLAWTSRQSTLAQGYRRVLIAGSLWSSACTLTFGYGAWELHELLMLLVLAVSLGTFVAWASRARARALATWQRAALGVLLFMVGCSALQLRRDQTRVRASIESFALHASDRHWAHAAALLDEPGIEHRIALTGGPLQNADNWLYYFFFGSRLQNSIHYVAPTRDGGVANFWPPGVLAQRADRDSWLARLTAGRTTEVLTFAPYSIEQSWMDGMPERFEKLDGAHDWGLYRLRSQ